MPRRVEDIVIGNRRSIREISPEEVAYQASKNHKSKSTVKQSNIRRVPLPNHKSSGKWTRKKTFLITGITVLVLVVVAGYAATAYFSRAVFTIIPKIVPVTVNGTQVRVAKASAENGIIAYNIVTINLTASTTVDASDGPSVETKAKGKITLFNFYSSKTRRIIAGTRISNDSGLVYHTISSVVIPGTATSSSGTVNPGSISVDIVADEAGEKYNIIKASSGDFRIIAYKGTDKYQAFLGKLSSDIAGGFSGSKKSIDPVSLSTASASLKSQLAEDLTDKLKDAVPADSILYKGASVSSFSSPSVGAGNPKSATVSVSGSIYGIVFNKSELIALLAGDKTVESFGKFPFSASDLNSLVFSIANPKDFLPAKKNTLLFRLGGSMKLIADIPVDDLKRKLAGLPLVQTQQVLKPYNIIMDPASTGQVVPPWSNVPTDLSRISIIVEK